MSDFSIARGTTGILASARFPHTIPFRTMNIFSHFRHTTNDTSNHIAEKSRTVESQEVPNLDSPEVPNYPPAFAYVATSAPSTSYSEVQAVSSDREEHHLAEKQKQNAEGESNAVFGALFLIAFHGSLFILKHIAALAITMLSYADHDIAKKYISKRKKKEAGLRTC